MSRTDGITLEFQRDSDAAGDARWLDHIAELRTRLARASTKEEQLQWQGRLGDWLRARPQTVEEAVALLDEVVTSLRTREEPGLLVTNLVRLATALQYARHHARAVPVFEEAIELASACELQTVKGFAHQHVGKCLVEMGELARARREFTRALEIRLRGGDQSLIASTRRALEGLEEIAPVWGRHIR